MVIGEPVKICNSKYFRHSKYSRHSKYFRHSKYSRHSKYFRHLRHFNFVTGSGVLETGSGVLA
jgi:hypothetical protein